MTNSDALAAGSKRSWSRVPVARSAKATMDPARGTRRSLQRGLSRRATASRRDPSTAWTWANRAKRGARDLAKARGASAAARRRNARKTPCRNSHLRFFPRAKKACGEEAGAG